jgi:type I restriction enzyme S subunit
MDEMRFYKETNFKDTEIGRIPKDWEVVRLGEVAEIKTGKSNVQDATEDGPYLLFDRSGEVKKSNKYLFDKEAVIVPGEGEEFLPKYYCGKFDLHQRAYAIFDFSSMLDGKYLFYAMHKLNRILIKLAVGTTVRSLRLPMFKNLLVALPPLSEQEKIAEILSTVDELIQRTDEIIAKTERLKKGLMQELLTKGIGHKEFKETEIGRIPKDWEVVSLGSKKVSVLIKSGTTPSKQAKEYWNGDIPFVTQADMTKVDHYLYETSEKITELGLKSSNLFIVPKNSVLLSMYGTIGKVVLNKTPVAVSQNIAAVIPNRESVEEEYLLYVLQKYSTNFKKQAKIITLKHLDIKIVKNTSIPLPPLSEQEKIADILSTLDEKIEIERKRREKLERIKKSLMDLLLTGKIRVRIEECDNDGRENK